VKRLKVDSSRVLICHRARPCGAMTDRLEAIPSKPLSRFRVGSAAGVGGPDAETVGRAGIASAFLAVQSSLDGDELRRGGKPGITSDDQCPYFAQPALILTRRERGLSYARASL
jgi:hypothetical protein